MSVCAAAKSSNQLRMGTDTFLAIPLQPFTSWAMDLVGPLPPTKKGHIWIVTWADHTSKMIVTAATADGQMTSEKLGAPACTDFEEYLMKIYCTGVEVSCVIFVSFWCDVQRRAYIETQYHLTKF